MSMRVRILLLSSFRETVGKREIVEEVNSNSTLGHVLDKLAKKYGRDFKQLVDPKTKTVPSEFIVSINGRVVRDTEVRLNNDDILMLTLQAGGG